MERQRRTEELMRADLEPAAAHSVPESVADAADLGTWLGPQPLDDRQHIGHGRIRHVVGAWLDVQHDLGRKTLREQTVGQHEIRQQLASGVVCYDADGRVVLRTQRSPEQRTVVDEDALRPGFCGSCVQLELEAEVGAVTPQRGSQQRLVLQVPRRVRQYGERTQFFIDVWSRQLGVLDRSERVDSAPGAGPEVADSLEQSPVEVAFAPQERHVTPRSSVEAFSPRQPIGTVMSRLGQRLEDAGGAFGEKLLQHRPLSGGVRRGVQYLTNQLWVPLVEHTPLEGAGDRCGDRGRSSAVCMAWHHQTRGGPLLR